MNIVRQLVTDEIDRRRDALDDAKRRRDEAKSALDEAKARVDDEQKALDELKAFIATLA